MSGGGRSVVWILVSVVKLAKSVVTAVWLARAVVTVWIAIAVGVWLRLGNRCGLYGWRGLL